MSRRTSKGEFGEWARLAWDRPAGAVAVFIIAALLYGPIPAAFKARMLSEAQTADGPLAGMVATAYANAADHLLPLIQGLAAILMAISVVAGVRHLYRHFRPRSASPVTDSRSGRVQRSTRRRYRHR